MSRRSLAVVAVATLTAGLLTGCNRTEDKAFSEFKTAQPTPVDSAPMVVPYPARRDQGVRQGGSNGNEG